MNIPPLPPGVEEHALLCDGELFVAARGFDPNGTTLCVLDIRHIAGVWFVSWKIASAAEKRAARCVCAEAWRAISTDRPDLSFADVSANADVRHNARRNAQAWRDYE